MRNFKSKDIPNLDEIYHNVRRFLSYTALCPILEIVNTLIFFILGDFFSWKKNRRKPQLQKLDTVANFLPISWGKVIKVSAGEYQVHINELWNTKKYFCAKWNQKLAWICAFSNLLYYLWLKVWKPVSVLFRRFL